MAESKPFLDNAKKVAKSGAMKNGYWLLVTLLVLGCDNGKSATERNQKLYGAEASKIREAKNGASKAKSDSGLVAWKAIKSSLKSHYDEFNKGTTYKDPISDKLLTKTGLTCYFVLRDNDQVSPLYWNVQYAGENWLFVKSYSFLIDGERDEYTPIEVKRDNASGTVWENSTNLANSLRLPMLQKIADSKVTKIRFNGKDSYDDYTVTSAEKKGLTKMIKAHAALVHYFGQ